MKRWILFLSLATCILVSGCIAPETRQDYRVNLPYPHEVPLVGAYHLPQLRFEHIGEGPEERGGEIR